MLIVGGTDWNVLELNDEAASLLGGPHELAIFPAQATCSRSPERSTRSRSWPDTGSSVTRLTHDRPCGDPLPRTPADRTHER